MKSITVNNNEELNHALSIAVGGDTILLAKSDGAYSIFSKQSYDSNITIKSADASAPATVSQIVFRGAENITVDNVVVHSGEDFASRKEFWQHDVQVIGSKEIIIKNSEMFGLGSGTLGVDTDAVRGNNFAIIRGSDGVTLENNEIHNYQHTVILMNNDNTTIKNNDMYQAQGDTIRMVEQKNLLIEGNYIHDILGSTYTHMDMIQLWSTNATSISENITIRGNILDAGDGVGTQSIFMRNELVDTGTQGDDFFYKNIVIEDNIIYNGHLHGITIGETDGVVVRNNTLLLNSDVSMPGHDAVYAPGINMNTDSINVSIENNIVAGQVNAGSDAAINNNLLVNYTSQNADNYIDKLFVNASGGGEVNLEGLKILPDSIAEGLGSSLSVFELTPAQLTAAYTVQNDPAHDYAVVYDASLTANSDGFAGDAATYTWEFSDGTVATGKVVSHQYEIDGKHQVKLTVEYNGEVDSFVAQEKFQSNERMDVNFEDNKIEDISPYALTAKSYNSDAFVEREDGGGTAYRLNSDNMVEFNRGGGVHGVDQMFISVDVQRSSETSEGGAILSSHASFYLGVHTNGQVFLKVFDSSNKIVEVTSEAVIQDSTWHNIQVAYDSINNTTKLIVDDAVVAETEAGASLHESRSWPVVMGQLYSDYVFDGLVDNLEISSDNFLMQSELDPDLVPEEIDSPVLEPTAIFGDSESDYFYGGQGGHHNVDNAYGMDGDDYIRAFNIANGGGGNDKLFADTRTGSKLYGEEGDDILVGYRQDDYLVGGEGADMLKGGGGDDILVIDSDDYYAQGGSGFDTIIVSDGGTHSLGEGTHAQALQQNGFFFHSIEMLDIENDFVNNILIDYKDILQSGNDQLIVVGDSNDNITFIGDYSLAGNVIQEGVTYTEINFHGWLGDMSLLLETDINITNHENRGIKVDNNPQIEETTLYGDLGEEGQPFSNIVICYAPPNEGTPFEGGAIAIEDVLSGEHQIDDILANSGTATTLDNVPSDESQRDESQPFSEIVICYAPPNEGTPYENGVIAMNDVL